MIIKTFCRLVEVDRSPWNPQCGRIVCTALVMALGDLQRYDFITPVVNGRLWTTLRTFVLLIVGHKLCGTKLVQQKGIRTKLLFVSNIQAFHQALLNHTLA